MSSPYVVREPSACASETPPARRESPNKRHEGRENELALSLPTPLTIEFPVHAKISGSLAAFEPVLTPCRPRDL